MDFLKSLSRRSRKDWWRMVNKSKIQSQHWHSHFVILASPYSLSTSVFIQFFVMNIFSHIVKCLISGNRCTKKNGADSWDSNWSLYTSVVMHWSIIGDYDPVIFLSNKRKNEWISESTHSPKLIILILQCRIFKIQVY